MSALADRPEPDGPTGLVPEGFRFGVATAGFQIEGGYNGPGEPKNNWYGWESAGRVEPSGSAVRFWEDYETHLDRAAGLGCDSFRLSVEWARVVPEPGQVDLDALDHYARILEACHARRLTPLVTLHHFTHPWWLGEDFWLRPDSPERFAEWVDLAVEHLAPHCTHWVTTNECNILAVETWLTGSFPPGRRGDVGSVALAIDHLLAGHVLAYDIIHARQPQAVVATNNFALSIYELDRLPTDLLLAANHGIDRDGLVPWLTERRARHYAATPLGTSPARRRVEQGLRRLAARNIALDRAYPRTTHAIFERPAGPLLDVVQLDWYSLLAADHFRLPGHRTAGGRHWDVGQNLWDDRPDPGGLSAYCARTAEPGLEVWVVENGMCNRVQRGHSWPRRDSWTRDRYLREHLAAMVAAVDRGVAVTGYWHWTLVDNYEWGSYQPRFGIFGVDRERGLAIGELDAMGVDAAGEYRRLIEGLRSGDRSVLAAPAK